MITLKNLKQFSEILEEIALLWMTYMGCHITKLPINKVNKPLQMRVCVCVMCVCGLKISICEISHVLND